MRSPRSLFRRISGHTILASALPARPLVVDLGMHQGEFAHALESIRPNAQVFGVEPQPDLAHALSARGADVMHAAVGGSGGSQAELLLFDAADMATIRSGVAGVDQQRAVGSVRVPIVSMHELIEHWRIDHADLVKVDIEGTEVELLAGDPATFSFARQISVEFHLWRYPADRTRVHELIANFRHAGWRVQDFSRVFDDVLFLHPDVVISSMALRSARLGMGAARKAGRLIRRSTTGNRPRRPN